MMVYIRDSLAVSVSKVEVTNDDVLNSVPSQALHHKECLVC